MKVDRTKCRHEGQVVKFSLLITKSAIFFKSIIDYFNYIQIM